MLIDNANILRQKRKTLKITISNDGQLTIFAPLKLSYVKIEELLKSKENLLNKKIAKKREFATKNKEILSYNKMLLMGREYLIIPTKKMGKAYFMENNFLIPQKYCCDLNKKALFIKKTLREISIKIVNNRVNTIIETYNNDIYKNIKKVVIGNFKAKWGSCDSDGVLKFNWKIIMLTPELIDFIIFHELTHLKELNHSKKFYAYLQNVVPKHKECRRQLKDFSFLLSLY